MKAIDMPTAYETRLMRDGPQHALSLIMRHMEPLTLAQFKRLTVRQRLALGNAWRRHDRSLAGIMAELRQEALWANDLDLDPRPAVPYNSPTDRRSA